MMSIVVALLGAVYCGMAIAQISVHQQIMLGVEPRYYVIFGVILVASGLVMMPSFGLAQRLRWLGDVVLTAASLTALVGICAIVFVYRNPFSWMTAILSIALLIDAVCLKIVLRKG